MPKAEPPSRRIVNSNGKSQIVVTPTGVNAVAKLAANGCKLETIAAALGISRETLNACRGRQVEVKEALDRGHAVMHDELVDILMQQARAGAFVPAIFLLKSRFGYREGGVDLNVNVNTSGVLVVPAEVTVEQYLAMKAAEGNLIDVTPQPAPALYPGHAPVEHHTPALEADPEPAPRPVPSGTTIAPFPDPKNRRGD